MNSVDIRLDHLQMVHEILQRYLSSDTKVWVFGSRAQGTAVRASDLDLAIDGDDSIDQSCLIDLKFAFEESHLPYRVDVVNLATVNRKLKPIIERQMIPLPNGNDVSHSNESH